MKEPRILRDHDYPMPEWLAEKHYYDELNAAEEPAVPDAGEYDPDDEGHAGLDAHWRALMDGTDG